MFIQKVMRLFGKLTCIPHVYVRSAQLAPRSLKVAHAQTRAFVYIIIDYNSLIAYFERIFPHRPHPNQCCNRVTCHQILSIPNPNYDNLLGVF